MHILINIKNIHTILLIMGNFFAVERQKHIRIPIEEASNGDCILLEEVRENDKELRVCIAKPIKIMGRNTDAQRVFGVSDGKTYGILFGTNVLRTHDCMCAKVNKFISDSGLRGLE